MPSGPAGKGFRKPREGRGRLPTERRRHGNAVPFHFRERRCRHPLSGSGSKASSGSTHAVALRVTAGMVSSSGLGVLLWGSGLGQRRILDADIPVLSPQKPILLQGHERSITQIKYNREGDLLFTVAKDPVSVGGKGSRRAGGTVRRGLRRASSFRQGEGWTSQFCRERGTKECPILRSRERPSRG